MLASSGEENLGLRSGVEETYVALDAFHIA